MTGASCETYLCCLFHLVSPTWWLHLTQLFGSMLQGFQSTCANRTENYLSQLVLRGTQCCFWFSVFIRSKSLCISYTKEMKILFTGVKVCGYIFQLLQVYSKYLLSLEMNSIVFCTVKLLHHALVYIFPPSDFNCSFVSLLLMYLMILLQDAISSYLNWEYKFYKVWDYLHSLFFSYALRKHILNWAEYNISK